MSKTIEKLKAAAAAQAAEEKPDEGEEKKGPETSETPADGDEKPEDGEPAAVGDGPAGETPSEEAPAENPGDEDDDEAKALAAIVAENAALKGRVALLEKAFKAEKAETARLRAALADPSFRYAAMRPQNVPASAAPDAAVTEQKKLAADLAACKTPEERIALLKSRKR